MKLSRRYLLALVLSALLPVASWADSSASSEMRWAQVNGTSLRYQLLGESARTVVLLHEMGMTLDTWDYVVDDLARDHRVLRYDLRGYGMSEKIKGAVTIQDEVEDLRALLDTLGLQQPVTLIGGAVGGAIALRFAATYPQRVRAVMAISPAVNTAAANPNGKVPAADQMEQFGARAQVDQLLPSIYPEAIQVGHVDRVARFRGIQYANDPVSMAATMRMAATTDWGATWSNIKCPTWVVAAALYPARSIASMQALADRLPNGHLEVINTGHFAAFQSPELFMPLAQKFFAQVER